MNSYYPINQKIHHVLLNHRFDLAFQIFYSFFFYLKPTRHNSLRSNVNSHWNVLVRIDSPFWNYIDVNIFRRKIEKSPN
jgi:hypothetical protein